MSIDNSTIGWNDISVLELNDISGNDLVDRYGSGSRGRSFARSSDDSGLRSTNGFKGGNGLDKVSTNFWANPVRCCEKTHLLGLPFGVSTDGDVQDNKGSDDTSRDPIHSTERDSHGGDWKYQQHPSLFWPKKTHSAPGSWRFRLVARRWRMVMDAWVASIYWGHILQFSSWRQHRSDHRRDRR